MLAVNENLLVGSMRVHGPAAGGSAP